MRQALLALVALTFACGAGEGHSESDEHGHDKAPAKKEVAAGEHDEHGGEGAPGEVHLAPEALERNEIRTAKVVMESFKGGTEVPAEVVLIPDRVAHVTSLIAGQVIGAVVSVGDSVTKGQVLATLRSVEVGQARADVARAQAAFDSAKSNFERQQTLEKEGIGAVRALQEARAAFEQAQAELGGLRARLGVYGASGSPGATVALRSPIAGTILERHATTGEVSKADEPLFVVADTSRVWVIGRVYEQNVGRIARGAAVTLRLAAYPERTWPGTLAHVASVLDEKTRTLPVRVELDNPDGVLRPGLFGSLTLASDAGDKPVPVVPESAVQQIEEREVVFVPGAESGEFKAVPVRVAGRDRGRAAIAEGLTAGTEVVVSGAFLLKSELLKDQMGEGHAH